MRRVLVVDDDDDIRHMLTRSLSRDFAIRCVASPEEARRLFDWDQFDVVVSDYWMPSGLGTDFLAEVRSRQPATLRILISGDDVPAICRVDRPWDVFLRKPFTVAALVNVMTVPAGDDVPRPA